VPFDPSNPDAIESTSLEFKAQFDPASRQDWCELIKDMVAIANSGGGELVVGLNDDGSPSGWDAGPLLEVDSADITNKIHSYTEEHFSDLDVLQRTLNGHQVAVVRIGAARIPMIFTSPGTYPTAGNSQKTAFGRGTIYFRHGAKSEPGTTADLAAAIERELERTREFWLAGIAKVVTAPPGSTVTVGTNDVALTNSGDAMPIRLTSDPNSPTFRAVQADKLYPYRQTELVRRLRERLDTLPLGSHDLLCVRRVHGTDDNPLFSHKAQWSPRQYSDAFVEWILEQHRLDPEFFQKARDAYRNRAS
jgi:hypothetical protein